MSNNGAKLTARQQKFAMAYTTFEANTEGNGLLSAIAAGYQGNDKSLAATASRTLAMVKVKRVIDGINAHRLAVLAEKTGYSIEQAARDYAEDRQFARKMHQAGAAVTATTGKCRLYGYDKDGGSKDTVTVINVVNYAGAAGVEPPKQVESEVIDE